MNDRISIALVTYNGAGYLKEQLDSIYTQTLLPYEVVAVDDASVDDTVVILEEYHRKYGLRYEVNPQSLGVNRNMEKAIGLCIGDYIALCDQDDVWMPHKIATSYNRLKKTENGKAAMVASSNITVNEKLVPKAVQRRKEADSDSYLTFLLSHHAQGCTIMMNRAMLDHILPFPPSELMAVDGYIGIVASLNADVSFIGKPLLYYRRHTHNISGSGPVNLSLLQRFRIRFRSRYPGFIRDHQFGRIRKIVEYLDNDILPERRMVCEKILALDCDRRFWYKLRLLGSFRELPFGQRCFVIGNFMFSYLLNR